MSIGMICVGLLFFAGLLLFALTFIIRHKFVSETTGRTFCIMVTETGKAHPLLLRDIPGGVKAPSKHPVQGGVYYVGPGQTYDINYPLHGVPKWMKIRAGIAFIAEGHSEAWAPFFAPPITSDKKAELAEDRTVDDAVMRTAEKEIDRLSGRGGVKPMWLYIGAGIVVFALLLIGIFCYLAYSQSSTVLGILKAYGY